MIRRIPVQWMTSSYCHFEKPICVEVASQGAEVLVRDSKRGDASLVLMVSSDQWSSFISDIDRLQA